MDHTFCEFHSPCSPICDADPFITVVRNCKIFNLRLKI